ISTLVFFFQAEDGIRYRNVTGVQTCALPILNRKCMLFHQDHDTFPIYGTIASQFNDPGTNALFTAIVEKLRKDYLWEISSTLERSEERRVGKECRSRGAWCHGRNNREKCT